MKNYISSGITVTIPATTAIKAGAICGVGQLVGIASNDVKTGDDLVIVTKGVFEVPLKRAETTTVGQPLYLSLANGYVTKTKADTDVECVALSAQVANDATVIVLLR